LKNAIDYLYKEWNHKAAGFVGYGSVGGARAIENLRLIMGELMVADVRAQVMLSLFTDWKDGAFDPAERHEQEVDAMLDQVIQWSAALKTLRPDAPPVVAPGEEPPQGRRIGGSA